MSKQTTSSDIELAEVNAQSHTNLFQNAHNFTIGNQVNVNAENSHVKVDVHHHHFEDILTARLNPIPDASYSRDRTRSPPDSRCLPGTRTKVLNEIKAWVESGIVLKEDPSHVLWLHGYVGCGKSAIAQAIAEVFAKKKRLAASYFFLRGSGERSKGERFAQTLAKDLVVSVPSTKPHITRVVEGEGSKSLSMSDLSHQVQSLFLDPYDLALSNPARRARQLVKGPFLAVIDGLDECEDRAQVSGLVERIVAFFKDNPRTPLRFLISSRVEQHIHAHLGDPQSKVYSMDLPAHTSDEDIESVIDETLKDAAKRDWVIRAYGAWPSPEERRKLVARANKSLVAISTLLRFILIDTRDGTTAKDRLVRALDLSIGLDGLYTELLAGAESRPHFRSIVTTIALVKGALSIDQLTGLLHLEPGDVINVVGSMCSIFHVPGDDRTPVTPCHSSFREFLTTEERSMGYYASPSYHRLLAHRFFEHMDSAESDGTYANRFSYHWPAYIDLHHDNPLRLRQELKDLITLFLTLDTAPSQSSHSVISAYSVFDYQWVNRMATKTTCSIGEFLAAFLGIREKTSGWVRATSIVDSIDHVSSILYPEDDFQEELPVILQNAGSRSTSISSSPNPCVTLLTNCVAFLFVHRQWNSLPVAFLPFSGKPPSHEGDDEVPDVAGYAFWAFGRHLAQTLKQHPGILAEEMVIPHQLVQSKTSGSSSARESSEFVFDFTKKQGCVRRSFDLARYIDSYKSNLRVKLSTWFASGEHWVFKNMRRPQDKADRWVYGCVKDDFSLLNLWTGYHSVAMCYLAWMDGSHDEVTCPLHFRYNQARR